MYLLETEKLMLTVYVLFLNRGRTAEHVFRNQGQISRNNLVLDKESETKYQT